MINEKDKATIEDALKRICTHSLFANSSTYTRLLKYLVEKAIAGEDLKEFTIGADLFGRNYTSDKNDGTVRSYMYKLRKKLTAYYSESGAQERIIFRITKGQYNLSFISPKEYYQRSDEDSSNITIPVKYLKTAAFGFIAVILFIWIGGRFINQPDPLWKPFFSGKTNNLVVVSDQYTVTEIIHQMKRQAVLYDEINSSKDYLEYSRKYPERKLKTTDYTVMSKMAPYCIKTISEWFISNKSNYSLELESKLTYEDIRNNNILFIGQYKTMNLSRSLFLKDSKVFTTFRDGFKYKKGDSEKIYDTTHGKNGRIEYAMVSYTSLSPGKNALYFVSNNDIGVLATVNNFTHKEWLKNFRRQLPEKTKYFNALFEVSGLQRTEVSCKLVEIETFDGINK